MSPPSVTVNPFWRLITITMKKSTKAIRKAKAQGAVEMESDHSNPAGLSLLAFVLLIVQTSQLAMKALT